MFLDNKYRKWYGLIIENAQHRVLTDVYTEKHHIIPKSLGGSNLKENIVKLTAKEHFICHRLLYKSCTGKNKAKMAYAFLKMCSVNKNQKRITTARQFEKARKYVSESCTGENHHLYKKQIWSEEQRNDISKRQTGSGNSMYGKVPWNKGKQGTVPSWETKKKISESLKGRHRTAETKLKISEAHKGKVLSDITKEKLRQANLGKARSAESIEKTAVKLRGKKQKIVECPHCGKTGGTTMYRWHFDNCKQR